MKKIFLEDLPKRGEYIDWKKCIGYNVKFIYDSIEGEFKIVGYEDGYLKLRYKEKCFLRITTGNFKKCCIGNILGLKTKEFKYEVNQCIKDCKRDLIILDRKYMKDKNGINRKLYKYKCNKCGFDCEGHYKDGEYKEEYWISESGLIIGNGCACCCHNPKIAVPNINSIWATDIWMMDFGVSEKDAKTHTRCSGKKIEVICPDCGNKKIIRISSLFNEKSIACICGDGISYPEKVMYALLKQLKVDFETQYSPNWIGDKRYDFYISSLNMIIETHGKQHYKDNTGFNTSLQEQEQNDKFKRELALQNGVKYYIEIDARKSILNFIKFNILNSELNNLFNLSNVDWNIIEKFSIFSNKKKDVCYHWNNKHKNETTTDIANKFGVQKTTVITWLKDGSKLGWCNYNPKEELKKTVSQNGKRNGKKVEIFKNRLSLGIFKSASELERQSEELFGVKLLSSNVGSVCLGKLKHYKGYTFEYI